MRGSVVDTRRGDVYCTWGRRSGVILSKRGKRIVVRAQTQKQKQRDEPDTYRKESCDVHERRRVVFCLGCPVPILWASGAFGFLGFRCEVKEPDEVVGDDEDAGQNEARRDERDEGPGRGKVGEVDEVAEDGEEGWEEGEAVRQDEEDVNGDDGVYRSHADEFGMPRVLLYEFS